MKLFRKGKDGGPKSTVTGYWLIELKRLFSIVLLKFEDGSRDEYHDHAFDSLNWVFSGRVDEVVVNEAGVHTRTIHHVPSWRPVLTRRSRMHRVVSRGTTWVLSVRGPWKRTWHEYSAATDKFTILTHGRKVVRD